MFRFDGAKAFQYHRKVQRFWSSFYCYYCSLSTRKSNVDQVSHALLSDFCFSSLPLQLLQSVLPRCCRSLSYRLFSPNACGYFMNRCKDAIARFSFQWATLHFHFFFLFFIFLGQINKQKSHMNIKMFENNTYINNVKP